MQDNKLPYVAPTIQSYGSVSEITGTDCIDLGIIDTKDLGFPSDTNWKFIPTCDAGNGSVS